MKEFHYNAARWLQSTRPTRNFFYRETSTKYDKITISVQKCILIKPSLCKDTNVAYPRLKRGDTKHALKTRPRVFSTISARHILLDPSLNLLWGPVPARALRTLFPDRPIYFYRRFRAVAFKISLRAPHKKARWRDGRPLGHGHLANAGLRLTFSSPFVLSRRFLMVMGRYGDGNHGPN